VTVSEAHCLTEICALSSEPTSPASHALNVHFTVCLVFYSLSTPERRPTDKDVFPSLVRHCGTCCRSLFVTHL